MGGATQYTYQYDDLNRLIHAAGSFDYEPNKQHRYQLDITYDTIHNITAKTQRHEVREPSGVLIEQHETTYAWQYPYAGPQPHAPTQVGERTFSYDADGNPLTATFMDYGLISAAELPSFERPPQETPTPRNPLGAKGIGESGTIGATPAVQNAVVDALTRNLAVTNAKHGIRASHTAEVVLDDVRVPGRCLLGGKEKLDERLARVERLLADTEIEVSIQLLATDGGPRAEIGAQIKAESPFARTYIIGLANGNNAIP